MAHRFGRETRSVQIPDDWQGRHDPECATIRANHDIGALQISAAFKDSEVTDVDLRDFAAEHLEVGATPKAVQLGDFVGFVISFATRDALWRQWFVRNGRQALFVTYNCVPSQRGVEDAAVDEVLATLSASGENVA